MLHVSPLPENPPRRLKIAALMGGASSERDVSLSSGRAVLRALDGPSVATRALDAAMPPGDLAKALLEFAPDVVFNALHGVPGEDGSFQGFLDVLGLPYTHSDVAASALAMDKARTRDILAMNGLPVAPGRVLTPQELNDADPFDARHGKYVVKPVREGSSVGVHILEPGKKAERRRAASDLRHFDHVLAERFVAGLELTVGVLDDRALDVTEIKPAGNHAFYDFDAKYAQGGSIHVLPAPIGADLAQRLKRDAERAHKVLGCTGPSRCDFRHDPETGETIIMEVNSQPGMTSTSLLPEQALRHGLDFTGLCLWIALDPLRRLNKLPDGWENAGMLGEAR